MNSTFFSLQFAENGNVILFYSFVVSFLFAISSFEFIKFTLKKTIKKTTYNVVMNRVRFKYYPFFVLLGLYFALYVGNFSETVEKIGDIVFPILLVSLLAYLVVRIFDGIVYSIFEEYAKKTKTHLDDMLLPIIKNIVYLTSFLVIIIIILAKLGYDVSAFITGLGVGGLALAMASQEIIKNFFGGMVIMFDGTFKIGDRIKVKGYEGKVKEISLRATRIVLDDSSIVNIPNSIVLKEAVVNYSVEEEGSKVKEKQ